MIYKQIDFIDKRKYLCYIFIDELVLILSQREEAMKREDAFYFKHLLLLGFTDGYEEWLNYYLETESPLSDIVLELSVNGSDFKKIVSLLHNFCLENEFVPIKSKFY